MKLFFLIFFLIFAQSCSKPKTVLICGDHKCVNKAEAEQYFEENLSIEVKIINKDKKKNFDLVELNLDTTANKKNINIIEKNKTDQVVKILTNQEIKEIKKKTKKNKKVSKKRSKDEIIERKKYYERNTKKPISMKTNNKDKMIKDVCSIVVKCNIEEISKYLIKIGSEKKFPDITKRQ